MDERSGSVVLYVGKKFFWSTKNTVDVTIVEHTTADVTEVICYDSGIDKESPRIYLNSAILSIKIDRNDIAEKLNFVNDVVHRATADFILNRLVVMSYAFDPPEFVVKLKLYFCDHNLDGDCDCEEDNLVCKMPCGLRCYPTRTKLLGAGEVNATFTALHEEQMAHLQDDAQARTADPFDIKERWRIPAAVNRTNHNSSQLSEADKGATSSAPNASAQDDSNPFAGVALRIDSSSPTSSSAGKRMLAASQTDTKNSERTTKRMSNSPRNGATPHNSMRTGANAGVVRGSGSPRSSSVSPTSIRRSRLKQAPSTESVMENKAFVNTDSYVSRSDDSTQITFLGQVVSGVSSGLSSLTASLSSKFKSTKVYSGSDDNSGTVRARISQRESQKVASWSLSVSTEDASAPSRRPSLLRPHHLSSGSSSPRLPLEDVTSVRLADCRPVLTAQHSMLRLDTGIDVSDSEYLAQTVIPAPPVRRSSNSLRAFLSAALAPGKSSKKNIPDSPSRIVHKQYSAASLERAGRMYRRGQDRIVPIGANAVDGVFEESG